jgi:threonine/homoserine/homoserine lactone efflux protein
MLFLKGLLIGFCITMPIGPISMLCAYRTVKRGFASGLISGIGAAIAYSICGVAAALMIPLFMDFLIQIQYWLKLAGGVFLIYLGALIFLHRPPKESAQIQEHKLFFDLSTSFLFTLTNPMSLLSFLAVFAAFGLSLKWKEMLGGTTLLLGIFVGSSLWWLLLSESLTHFKKKFTTRVIFWINRATGLAIFCFGVFAILTLHKI